MRYPHAAKGITKILIAEILMLIMSLSSIILIIMMEVSGGVENLQTILSSNGMGTAIVVTAIVTGGFVLVGGLLMIIGYFQAAKDEEGFVRAIIMAVVSIVLTIIASFLQDKTGTLAWVYTIVLAASQITWLFVSVSAIGGMIDLSYNCGRSDMVRRGNTILRMLETVYILTFIIIVLKQVFNILIKSEIIRVLMLVMESLIAVLSMIQYFLYLGYLGRVSSMLRNR